ncbi:hypothetical protein RMCBS344292_17498 [Rhizopus microsporus]|nr:hypothetical protein RMCBS344292_17498 [Rhizopus microsporus]
MKRVIIGSLLVTLCHAALRRFELNINYKDINPDCHSRSFRVPTINGLFPGPTLYATQGDEVEILVRNRLPNANTSIHYHGIRQIGSTESDGVPGVTQDAITPGSTFVHRFLLHQQAGTYFYHAHVGLQDDSVQGAFIIYESSEADPNAHKSIEKRSCKDKGSSSDDDVEFSDIGDYDLAYDHSHSRHHYHHDHYYDNSRVYNQVADSYDDEENYDYDEDYDPAYVTPKIYKQKRQLRAGPYTYQKDLILQLSEWWHDELDSRQDYYMGSVFKYDHGSDSILINGRTVHDPSETSKETCPGYTTFDVEPNTVYRLRIIGGNTFRTLALAIKHHNMTLIEVDGELVHPYETSFLEVTPGQRFSVLFRTGDYTPGMVFAIGTSYLWRQRGRGITENGFGYIRYVEREREDNVSYLFKPLTTGGNSRKKGNHQWNGKKGKRADEGHHNRHNNGKSSGGGWGGKGGGGGGGWGNHHRPQPFIEELPTFPKLDRPDWLWHNIAPLAGRDPMLDEMNVRTIKLHTTMNQMSDNTTRYLVNHRVNPDRHIPAIHHYRHFRHHHHKRATDEYDDNYYTDLHTYRIAYNETVDLVFQNSKNRDGGCLLHPWHTHGHSHYVIASGPGDYNHTLHKHVRNFKHPLYKDTSVAYPYFSNDGSEGCGWTKVRIKADNPGFWAVHCHITTHMIQGKMIVLEEAPDLISRFSLYNRQ